MHHKLGCVNSSHLINVNWLTTVEQFASGISQYPSESSTSIHMLEMIPGTARGWGSSWGCLGQEKHRERPKTVRRNTERANVEVTADRMGVRGAQESGVREIKQPETLRHREKSAMWTWVLVWKPHLFILVIGALILLNVWYNQPFQSCF